MAKLQLIISDPRSKTTRSISVEGVRAQPLVGKGIGETVDARLLNLGNAILKVTGGTDKDGIPMRWDIQGTAKKKALLTEGVGFREGVEGERRRKLVRGRVIGEDTAQVNSMVAEGTLVLPETGAQAEHDSGTEPGKKEEKAKTAESKKGAPAKK